MTIDDGVGIDIDVGAGLDVWFDVESGITAV